MEHKTDCKKRVSTAKEGPHHERHKAVPERKNRMTANKLASIIILNLNGEEILSECLDRLLAQTYQNFEILIVDNGSSDGSVELIKNRYGGYSNIILIENDENVGVPEGRNVGLREAKGDIIVFLDNDGFVDKEWLEKGIETLYSADDIGSVASLVFFADKKDILNGAGGTINLQGYGCDLCSDEPYKYADIPNEVLYPMGCGMFLKREVLKYTGFFDSILFYYYEDLDFGISVWRSGYRIVVAKEAIVYHKLSYSSGFLNSKKFYLYHRNRIRTVLKHFPFNEILRWLFREFKIEINRRFPTFAKAWLWNLRHLSSLLKFRRSLPPNYDFFNLMDKTIDPFSLAKPQNLLFRPDPESASLEFTIGKGDEKFLNYGWYHLEKDLSKNKVFRWSYKASSVILRIPESIKALGLDIRFCSLKTNSIRVDIIDYDSAETIQSCKIEKESDEWKKVTVPTALKAGTYELQFRPEFTYKERSTRQLGFALSKIEGEV